MSGVELFFLGCFAFGLIYALLLLLFGDASTGWVDGFVLPPLHPVVLVGGVTAFGGSGFLLDRYANLALIYVCLAALAIAAVLSLSVYFLLVRPMRHAENSVGYSMNDLIGKIGYVWTTVPADGLGEVVVTMVGGTTSHMAVSVDRTEIAEGTRVVVVDVRDHVLQVALFH
nr:NfeD family protein [Brevibacillus fulvus]